MKVKTFLSKKFFLITIIALIFTLTAGSAYYFYAQYQKSQKLLANPAEAIKEETRTITQKLGKLMELPAGEEPSVATIMDKDKVKDQPFLARSQNGDKVIVYSKALKAILYRPSTNKVIDVVPVNTGSPSAQPAPSVRIALYNGTGADGADQTFETDLKAKANNVDIVSKQNAKKTTYAETLVIDIAGNKSELAEELAKLMKGKVAALPEGEATPSSDKGPVDLLVIVGKDSVQE